MSSESPRKRWLVTRDFGSGEGLSTELYSHEDALHYASKSAERFPDESIRVYELAPVLVREILGVGPKGGAA